MYVFEIVHVVRIPVAQTEFTKIFKLRTLTVHNGTIIDPEHSGDLTLCNGRSHGASCRTHLLAAGLLGDPGRVFVMLALRSASTHLARDLLEAEHRVGLVHQRGHGDRDEHRREGVVRELR